MPVPVPSGVPGEIRSQYEPAHPPPRTPINGEPTRNGRQRLLIPVGHSVSKSSKKAKSDHSVTAKSHKKSDPTPTSSKKRKKDKTVAAA